ncbi:MAG TPA: flagellar basal body rod C-terminal domain-containing protein, partial [Planctomycetota bacterium]|nr:flagellar basal body rod C-terminal domain-containing protein [Planctomycetota bacterium]
VSQARNLTINVLDTATGIATKHVVRYEPGSDPIPASRSLDDLVSAINSGRGGGFSVHPPSAGIPGIGARVVPVDGGLKLELTADAGMSIDFSPALDVRPAAAAWTGADVTVSGGNAALAGRRLEFMVQNGGSELAIGYRDGQTGLFVPYPAPGGNTVTLPAGGTLGGIVIAPSAGAYADGESFTVDLDATGAISGSVTRTSEWTAGSATATFAGRYTGGLGFAPTQPWSMRVLSSGVIGAPTSAAPPNNPPVVEFTYWASDVGGAVSRTVTRTLDATSPAGSPVAIADGVYASFGAGTLTAGDETTVLVDGQPDQAGILPALGINGLFQGSDARTIGVASRLRADPNQFATGRTRSAGDNANVLALIATRGQRVLDDGQFTIESAYQSTVSEVGVRVDQNKRLSDTQELVRSTLENRRSDASGVSIDEEVGELILEQQAYAAAARLITTARENITTLLDLIG